MNPNRLILNSICRLCVKLLETEKVSPIFNNEKYAQCPSLSDRIHYCSSVEVSEGDGLPAYICSNCLLKLNQSFVFRNQCVLADNALKQLVKNADFSLSEIPNLSDIDCENQIIEKDCFKHNGIISCDKQDSKEFKSEFEFNDDVNIDEYDNSKNGRHKQNINKTKDRSIQKAKIIDSSLEGKGDGDVNGDCLASSGSSAALEDEDSDVSNTSNQDEEVSKQYLKKKKKNHSLSKKVQNILNACKKNESKSSTLTKQLSRFFELYSEKENRGKAKRLKKSKEKKVTDNEVQIKEECVENEEGFIVGEDIFTFDETKKEMEIKQEDNMEDETKELSQKRFKRSLGDKISSTKRGRPRKYPISKEKPTSFTCDYCQKVYPSEGGWRYHIHTMHNENYQPFICDLCGKAFKVKKNLEGHKNSIHYHMKQHLCDLCGRGFASKYALKVHKIWHNDEKNFPCDICGTKFRTRGKMNTHRSIHGGPKKFMCHVCSRDFRWKKDFEIHMRTHTGEKPFKCSHCGKAFSSLTNMKKHERNHSGKFGAVQSPEMYEMRMNLPSSDERLYKGDIPFSFTYNVDDLRNRPGE